MRLVLAFLASLVAAAPALAIDWSDFTGGGNEPSAGKGTWKDFDAPASADEMKALGIDADLAEMMRNRTGGPATLLRTSAGEAPIGLQWPTESTASAALVGQLREELGKRGFVVFVSDRSFGTGPDHVAIVRAKDPVEAVTMRMSPPGVKADEWSRQLTAWRKEAAWELVGVGSDWLEIEFRDALANPDRWVDEIARIAPAAAEGTDGRNTQRDALVRTRRALLWWKLPERPKPEP